MWQEARNFRFQLVERRLLTIIKQKLLGQIPLSTEIRALTDAGTPPTASTPAGEVSDLYVGAARSVAAELWQNNLNKSPAPTISMDDQ